MVVAVHLLKSLIAKNASAWLVVIIYGVLVVVVMAVL